MQLLDSIVSHFKPTEKPEVPPTKRQHVFDAKNSSDVHAMLIACQHSNIMFACQSQPQIIFFNKVSSALTIKLPLTYRPLPCGVANTFADKTKLYEAIISTITDEYNDVYGLLVHKATIEGNDVFVRFNIFNSYGTIQDLGRLRKKNTNSRHCRCCCSCADDHS